MMGRLNALSAILEVNPLTPDRLLSSLPDVNDWNQFNQFNQFCSTLFEDVSGEVFEPQTFDTLFPDYEQKQNPVALDLGFGVDSLSTFSAAGNANPGANISNNNISNVSNVGYVPTTSSLSGSIYSDVLPDDPFATTTSMAYGSASLPWDLSTPTPGVINRSPAGNRVQQPQANPFAPRYVMPNVRNANTRPAHIKIEPKEEALENKVVIKVERTYADMSTQTKAKQEKYATEGSMMMMQRPASSEKKKSSSYEGMDATTLLMNAPAVPDTPLPELDDLSLDDLSLDDDDEHTVAATPAQESKETVESVSTQQTSTTRYEGLIQKARARQAAAIAAAAAATPEPLDPLDAMTRQLAQTRLDDSNVKTVRKPATTKPVTEGDMERQIRAAKARSLCSQDPVRKQHAEVVLNLLKSIDTLMADHQQKLAQWKATEGGVGAPRVPVARTASSSFARAPVNVQNQGQIRTVSSYLPRRTPHHQPSPLHQDHNAAERSDPNYSQLLSNLAKDSNPASYLSTTDSEAAVSSAVLYPTSNLNALSSSEEEVPFELSEEERRFIEEDNAKIAAAQAARSAVSSVQV
ncbi:hypothetical protein BGX28_002062 [Mortierella sp. GBA30]|nr:hypothetical protein BGX28_002062 [Mortierella sp. GBA30]